MIKNLKKVEISGRFAPTGRTRHVVGGREAPVPSLLLISQYDGDSGFYLLYCDSEGREITDTYHDDIRGAMDQAKWEFEIPYDAWSDLEN